MLYLIFFSAHYVSHYIICLLNCYGVNTFELRVKMYLPSVFTSPRSQGEYFWIHAKLT